MKQFVLGCVTGILLVLAATLLAQEEGFYKGKVAYVLPEKENIRIQPQGAVMASMNKGVPLIVLEAKEKWVKVALTGWVWKESLTGKVGKLRGQAYTASMIVVKTRSEAEMLLKRLNSGGDFAEIAKSTSIDKATASRGGGLGEFYKGEFAPTIENAIISLKPGELSAIIESPAGFHIFKRTK